MRQKLFWAFGFALLGLIVLYILVSWHRAAEIKPAVKVTVTIPPGATVADINKELKAKGVFNNEDLPRNLEGYLFPDTYEFFAPSSPEVVFQKFMDAFNSNAALYFTGNRSFKDTLTVASLIEREVPSDGSDRAKVSGIVWKRLDNGMPLQIDATLCYAKELQTRGETKCYPLKPADFADSSGYNTYRYTGLPPSPIGNPGADAIYAAVHPAPSPYWFFLSDPETKKTIFAKTLDEHNRNIVKYLE